MNNEGLRDLFLAQHSSKHTRDAYARGLAVFARVTDDKPYEDVTMADVQAFKDFLANDRLTANTQLLRWQSVRSLYEWMMRSGILSRTPFAGLKPPAKRTTNRTPRVPSDVTFERIVFMEYDECETARDVRDRAILRLLGNGLRVSEVADLKMDDVWQDEHYDMNTGHPVWVVRVNGKGVKERLVPVVYYVADAIKDWTEVRQDDSEWLFVDPVFGGQMTVRQVQQVVYRRAKTLGIKGVHAHMLRHHYATRLVRAGAPLMAIQGLLGHSSVATTQVYVNLDLTDAIKAAQMDPFA